MEPVRIVAPPQHGGSFACLDAVIAFARERRHCSGENSLIPLFLRVSSKVTKEIRFDFYGPFATAGKHTIDNANGSGRYGVNYKIGPAPGATPLYRF